MLTRQAFRDVLIDVVTKPTDNKERQDKQKSIGDKRPNLTTYIKSPDDRVHQFILKGSKLPTTPPDQAAGIHNPNTQQAHSSDPSTIDSGSIRAVSVASSSVISQDEPGLSFDAPGRTRPQYASQVSISVPPSECSEQDGGSIAGLTSSSSSDGYDVSVTSSMGCRQVNQSMRLLDPTNGVLAVTLNPPLRPAGQACVLECPLKPYNRCPKEYALQNRGEWIRHVFSHFVKQGRRGPVKVSPPNQNSCCFCEAKFEAVDGITSWRNMLVHIIGHHELGHRLAHARVDFPLVEYLWENRLIGTADYRELKPTRNLPTPPPSDEEGPVVPERPVTVVEEKRHSGRR